MLPICHARLRFFLLFVFTVLAGGSHSQCIITSDIDRRGNACTDMGTLFLSGADSAAQIVWYQNGIPVYTVNRNAPVDSGVTVAGGTFGISSNQMRSPYGVFIDDSAYLYVSEVGNYRVMRFPPGSTAGTSGKTINGSTLNGGHSVGGLSSVWVDCNKRVYATDLANNSVDDFSNHLAVIGDEGVGNGPQQLNNPQGIFMNCDGDILVADRNNNRIQKFPGWVHNLAILSGSYPHGVTVAGGNGNGSAANQLSSPCGVWQLPDGDILVGDPGNNRVQKFTKGSSSSSNGVTIIGNGMGSALNQLSGVNSIWVDNAGYIYVSDENNVRVLKFPPDVTPGVDGIVVAGGYGYGNAANQLAHPKGLCVDWHGNIYIADVSNYRVQMWRPNGWIDTTYVPSGAGTFFAEVTFPGGCSITSPTFTLEPSLTPSVSISINNDTICPRGAAIFKAWPISGGCSPSYQWYVNGSPAGINADTFSIRNLATDDDSVWVVMTGNSPFATAGPVQSNTIGVNLEDFSPLAFRHLGNGCAGTDTLAVSGASFDAKLYWYGAGYKTSIATRVSTIAGEGTDVLSLLPMPTNIFIDKNGFYYVSDNYKRVIRFPPHSLGGTSGKVLAGGSYGTALNQFRSNHGIFVDDAGNLYVADAGCNRVIKYPPGSDTSTYGIVVAGKLQAGSSANQLNGPESIWMDSNGYLYVADAGNHRIQKFPPGSDSTTSAVTIAGGNGNGNALNQLSGPSDFCFDADGNLYVTDPGNHRVQKFPAGSTSATNAVTVAGGVGIGSAPYQFNQPNGIALGTNGEIFVCDKYNHRVLKFSANSTAGTSGEIVAGGNGFGSGDYNIYYPFDIAVDTGNNVYVADFINNRIQKWSAKPFIDTTISAPNQGNYYVQRTTLSGCRDTAGPVMVSAVYYANVDTMYNMSCSDSGYVKISITGGQPNYHYQWSSGLVTDSPFVSISMPGIYSLTVSDTSGCEATRSFLVNNARVQSGFDLTANLIAENFRVNSLSVIRLDIYNDGCQPLPGVFKLILDTLVSFVSAYPMADSISGDTLFWSFDPMNYDSLHFKPNVLIHTKSTAPIGGSLCLTIICEAIAGDADTVNNVKRFCYKVLNGSDPNDIGVYPEGACLPHFVTDTQLLSYTIRFQNTGNAEAINIFILDTLDAGLDMNSVRITSKSHEPLITEVFPGNVLKFRFDNIHLPDSASDETGSHGYIVYEVKPIAAIADRAIVENRAAIYFDSNEAVITNAVTNTVVHSFPLNSSIAVASCESYTHNNQTFTLSGDYTQSLTTSYGCDSTVTLHLTIGNATSSEVSLSACESFTLNSETYTTSGVYTQHFTNSQGCDSVLTLNLAIKNNSNSAITQTACESYTFNAQTYTASGVYTQTFINSNDCDSTVTLNLTINNSTNASLIQTACESYTLNSQTYTNSGIYSQLLTNAKGCDSTITLSLTINNNTSSSIAQTACETYSVNQQTYDSSGIYIQHLINSQGCDSALILNLTIHKNSSTALSETACDSFTLNSETYSASGIYTQTFGNSDGCDSVLTLNLIINTADNTVVQNANLLTAISSGAIYQWIDCDNSMPIIGETNQSFAAMTPGNFAVIVSENNCRDTSICYNILMVDNGINQSLSNQITIYPNPAEEIFTVSTSNDELYSYVVTDTKGAVILSDKVAAKQFVVDLSSFESGLYFLKIRGLALKLVKQ